MTCDERLEKLLNKSGQTISDLPNAYSLSTIEAKDIQEVACQWFVNEGSPEGVAFRNLVSIPLYQYILHLTDVIDRLEWALDKTVRERDYLEKRFGDAVCDCDICVYAENDTDYSPYMICDLSEKHFEFAGIPEDWRADDGAESDT